MGSRLAASSLAANREAPECSGEARVRRTSPPYSCRGGAEGGLRLLQVSGEEEPIGQHRRLSPLRRRLLLCSLGHGRREDLGLARRRRLPLARPFELPLVCGEVVLLLFVFVFVFVLGLGLGSGSGSGLG